MLQWGPDVKSHAKAPVCTSKHVFVLSGFNLGLGDAEFGFVWSWHGSLMVHIYVQPSRNQRWKEMSLLK